MKTEEANKLIAEFMGFEIFLRHNEFAVKYGNGRSEYLRICGNYNLSWDKIMPVVEKIESDPINDVCIYKEATQIRVWSGDGETFKWKVLEPDGSSKIAHVYRAVIKYIQWYNTFSTPTDKQTP